VAAVVHQDYHYVAFLLHQRGELAEVELQAAVADEAHGFALGRGDRRADRHRHAEADAAAERMHAIARTVDAKQAIAPGAVGDRYIAHPGESAAGEPLQLVHERVIRPEGGARLRFGRLPCRFQIAGERRIHPQPAEPLRELEERKPAVAYDE